MRSKADREKRSHDLISRGDAIINKVRSSGSNTWTTMMEYGLGLLLASALSGVAGGIAYVILDNDKSAAISVFCASVIFCGLVYVAHHVADLFKGLMYIHDAGVAIRLQIIDLTEQVGDLVEKDQNGDRF